MSCQRCGSSNIGVLEELPDQTAKGQSYRAAASGNYTQYSLEHRDAVVGPADWEVTDPNKIFDALRRRPRSPLAKLLSLLFTEIEVRAHDSTTKIGTIESQICGDCGALQWMLQDPQFFDWADARAVFAKEESMQTTKRCRCCNATELGLLAALPDTIGSEQEVVPQVVGITQEGERVGKIQAIVCTQCGLLEPFVASAREVPFESIEGFSWLKESPPFR